MAVARARFPELRQHAASAIFHYALSCLFLLAILAVLPGCAIQLGPSYDPSIVNALQEANEEAQTLFAGVSGGASRSTFSRREPAYNAVIGKLQATQLSASVRPFPAAPAALGEVTPSQAPTVDSLTAAAETITQMRNADQRMGLSPTLVEGFKRSFDISIAQALTYEKALQR